MANPFDVFDATPAAAPPRQAPPPGGNPFDRFDEPSVPTPPGALRVRVGPDRPSTVPAANVAAEAPGLGESALRGAAQGLTFGLSDEGTGVANASTFDETAPSWLKDSLLRYSPIVAAGRLAEGAQNLVMDNPGARDRYSQTVDDERAANSAARAAHPGAYVAGELGGGIASAVAAPAIAPLRAAQGAGMVARGAVAGGNLAATGAAYGGLAGAGEAEGGIGDRLVGAGRGAAIGGVAGPVVGGALSGGRAVGRYVADNARAITSPSTLADRVVGRAVRNDNADLPAIADRIEAAVGEGQPLALADAAGSNTQGVAGTVARTPGHGRQEAREFMHARQFGSDTVPSQGDRISDQLGRTLSDKSAIETGEAILARRQRDADRMYEAAYKRPLDYQKPEGQELLSLIDRIPNSAKREANEILKVSDRQGHEFVWDPTPDANGNYRLSAVPSGRHFDYIKQALDTAIERERNPITGKLTTYGGAVQGLKTEILSKLDALNPLYRQARQTFAGHAELYDALRSGADVFKPATSPEAIRKALDGMTPGEAEMFRLGAANALRERLANAGDGANKAALTYGNKAVREKIAALAPDAASRKSFDTFLRNERDMFATRQGTTGGSQTAERLGDDKHAGEMIVHGAKAAFEAGNGHVSAAIRSVFTMMGKVNPEHRARVMGEARKLLFDPNPETIRAFERRLQAAEMKAGTRDRIWATVTRALPPGLVETAGVQRRP